MHRATADPEYNSWSNSLRYMKDAVDTPEIPDGCGVAVEYNVPLTSKRVDFILSGRAKDGTCVANIVELKQWSDARDFLKLHICQPDDGQVLRDIDNGRISGTLPVLSLLPPRHYFQRIRLTESASAERLWKAGLTK